jgi:cbb3-type cytochrome oxidase subunit 3
LCQIFFVKKTTLLLLSLFFLCVFVRNVQAQGKEVVAYTDKTAMFIGDRLSLTVLINIDLNIPVKKIDWEIVTKKNWEISEAISLMQTNDLKRKASVNLTSFEVGEMTIPPIPVYVENGENSVVDTFFSDSIKIKIYPVEPDSTGLLPIKDIILEEKDISDYKLPIAVAILFLIGIAVYVYFRQKKGIQEAILYEKNQTPQAKALRRLKQLEAQNLPKQGKYKDFCSELTYILRAYLSEEYGFSALEMTSNEIIGFCKNEDILTEKQADLQQILNIADTVKFAQSEASVYFFEQAIAKTSAIIV